MPAPLIPLATLFADPARTAARVAPDGSRVAYLGPEEDRLNVWVRTIAGGAGHGGGDTCVTHDHARGIRAFWWSRDGRRIVYLQDAGGDENFHLFAVDVPGGDPAPTPASPRDLTPLPGVKAELVALPPGNPLHAVVALNARTPACFDAWRVDLATGERQMVAENPGSVNSWLADTEGHVRAALAVTPAGDVDLLVRAGLHEPFRTLRTYAFEDLPFPVAGRATMAGITRAGSAVWLASGAGADHLRLVEVDLTTGDEAAVDEHPGADLAAVVVDQHTGDLLAACYLPDRMVVHPLRPDVGPVLDRLRALHPGDPASVSTDAAGRFWAVGFEHDRDPGATYLLDTATGETRLLFRSRTWLDPDHLAPMEPVTIAARDGLALRGYLTLPLGDHTTGGDVGVVGDHTGGEGGGGEGARPRLPLVLVVHGGPWGRDSWGFHPEAQFLANRGYAVLQVNYRGSAGFGKAFMRAAVGQFAQAMHHDLLDAVAWAVAEGIADPGRVGIYGCSYGGYAALVGATFSPDVFAAAVSYAGVADLVSLIRSFPSYWGPLLGPTWFRYVGDPGTEDHPNPEVVADLLARSPVSRLADLRAPLLVIHGANDPRVRLAEADRLVDALRQQGVEVEYLVKEDEGHGFSNPENRLDAYAAMEAFFAAHLGGRRAD